MNTLKKIAKNNQRIPKWYREQKSIEEIKKDIEEINSNITNPHILNLKSLLLRPKKRIIKVEPHINKFTMDIELENNPHSYIANGTPVHNTINMPKETTPDQISSLLLEYLRDLKGVTVYVDGSRGGQVYENLTEEEAIEYIAGESVNDELSIDDVECKCAKPVEDEEGKEIGCEIPTKTKEE